MSIIEPTAKQKPPQNNPEDISNILDQLDQFSPAAESKKPAPAQKKAPQAQPQGEEISDELVEDAPSPTTIIQNFPRAQAQPLAAFSSSDQMQELIESIVEEKWGQVIEKFGDLGVWKERTNRDILAVKQELLRTQDRFQQLQRAVLGKVAEYNDNISNVNSELKALEKVFEKIIEPLTTNIKELQRITERLKK